MSAPLGEQADLSQMLERIEHHMEALRAGLIQTIPMIAQALATQVSSDALDVSALRQQGVPTHVTDGMLEANIGLQRALLEWRQNDGVAFATALKRLTADSVAAAVRRHLSAKQRSTLLLQPD